MTRRLALAAALVLGSLPVAARAAEPAASTMHVAYGDLDLSRTADARTLMIRLHAAASTACTPTDASDPLRSYAEWGRCTTSTLAASVREVNSPVLTALLTHAAAARPVVLARR